MKFIITILASVSLTDYFVWWSSARLLRKHGVRRRYRLALHGFMAFQVCAQLFIIFGRIRGWNIDVLLPMPLMIATFVWHLIFAPIALGLNILALAREAIYAGLGYLRRRKAAAAEAVPTTALPVHASDPAEATSVPSAPVSEKEPSLLGVSRRQFLAASVALAPPTFTILSSALASQQIQNFRIRRLTVPLAQLPKELDGLTVAHISDTHVGRFSHGKVLHKIADATNSLKADLVVVTGDIINDSLHWMPEAIDMLGRIDAPVHLCEGNHDLIADPFEFRTQMKALPDRYLLVNETRTTLVRGVPVQILGLGWYGPDRHSDQTYRKEFSLERTAEYVMKMRNPDLFQIMLAHHPHAWDHASEIPLTLAGHTHGGQLMLNEHLGAGPMMFRYWTGLYTREATQNTPQSALVVSNGAGNWFPLRIAAPAEIVHLTLRRI